MVWTNEEIAVRAAQELQDGDFLELGCGLPTRIASYIPNDIEVWMHSEVGIPGVALYATDDYMDAGFIATERMDEQSEPMRVAFHSTDSYAAMLSASADVCIVEAASISGGNINVLSASARDHEAGGWTPAIAAKRVIAVMSGDAAPCTAENHRAFSAPLYPTVDRVICSLAVLDVTNEGLKLVVAAGNTSKEKIESTLCIQLLA